MLSMYRDPYSSIDQDFSPDVDAYDLTGGIRIKVDLPGISKENLTIDFIEGNLEIAGVRESKMDPLATPSIRERNYGRFRRSVYLPAGSKVEEITADFKDGVLNVLIPREEKHAPKSVPVQ